MIKLVFFGSGSFPIPILKKLMSSKNIEVVGLVTSPNAGKGDSLYNLALASDIEILQPKKLSNAENDRIRNFRPDIILVCNYGQFLSESMLNIPKYHSLNIHCSLLPKLRGACPIEMAILKGMKKTGVTIQVMRPDMDTGAVIFQKEVAISKNETGGTLTKIMQKIVASSIIQVVEDWIANRIVSHEQQEQNATYCYRKDISKKAAEIDWRKNANEIERAIRAYNPRPIAWTWIETKQERSRLRILQAKIKIGKLSETPGDLQIDKNRITIQTGNNLIVLQKIQIEGKRIMDTDQFLRGFRQEFLINTHKSA